MSGAQAGNRGLQDQTAGDTIFQRDFSEKVAYGSIPSIATVLTGALAPALATLVR